MSREELLQVFQAKQVLFRNEVTSLSRQSTTLAIIRFALFVVLIGATIWFFTIKSAWGVAVSLAILALSFFILISMHNKVRETLRIVTNLLSINRREESVLNHNLSDIDDGSEYKDIAHPFTSDLDIFGTSSLFSLLIRNGTPEGRSILANWLKEPGSGNSIHERQEAVKELSRELEFRQELEGQKHHNDAPKLDFQNWLSEDSELPDWLIKITYPYVLLTLIVFALVFTQVISFAWIGLLFIVSLLILRNLNSAIEVVHKNTKVHIKNLDSHSKQFRMVENKEFTTSYLRERSELLRNSKASLEIKKLHRILDRLDNRANLVYWIFNVFLLLDGFIMIGFNLWRRRNKDHIEEWLTKLGEIDSICCLAGFSYSNPDFCFPEIVDQKILRASGVGHPLLPYENRIKNDFEIEGQGSLALITGSNMSGKSTFLRSLGINSVLAYAGAPVCSDQFILGKFSLFTSMRVVDDLSQNMSSFYAELARIKQLIDMLPTGETVFYLLDEILLGTNSNDRHAGSVALIEQLTKSNSLGLIATHDLKLGELSTDTKLISNYCFTSKIEGEEILFDYKIRDGIGYNFNATELMKKMGLKL